MKEKYFSRLFILFNREIKAFLCEIQHFSAIVKFWSDFSKLCYLIFFSTVGVFLGFLNHMEIFLCE